MGIFRNVFREMWKQFTETPGFSLREMPEVGHRFSELRESINQQIEEAFRRDQTSLIFVIAPFGGGKTSQIHYFSKKNPNRRYVWKSFAKISGLEFAFLHLTSFIGRMGLLMLGLAIGFLIIQLLPPSGALPFLLTVGYLFTRNGASLVYTLHEALDNLSGGGEKIFILEDLERSALSFNEQWGLLSNLWEYKRKYIITLGYSPDEKKEKLRMLEYAMKLGGAIIEIPTSGKINLKVIQKLDRQFPFQITPNVDQNLDDSQIQNRQTTETGEEWLALFTPREMEMIHEQVLLKTLAYPLFTAAISNKQTLYIEICLDLLSKKLGLEKEELSFDRATGQIKSIPLDPDKTRFVKSFEKSMELGSFNLSFGQAASPYVKFRQY